MFPFYDLVAQFFLYTSRGAKLVYCANIYLGEWYRLREKHRIAVWAWLMDGHTIYLWVCNHICHSSVPSGGSPLCKYAIRDPTWFMIPSHALWTHSKDGICILRLWLLTSMVKQLICRAYHRLKSYRFLEILQCNHNLMVSVVWVQFRSDFQGLILLLKCSLQTQTFEISIMY